MRKIFRVLVLIPLGVIFVIFAVANRHMVSVSFDPFNSSDPALSTPPLPLFMIIFGVAIAGVAIGGSATWFRQGRWRRAARQHEADARQMRTQLADLRANALTPRSDLQRDSQRLPALAQTPIQAGGYVAIGRDKQSATL